MGCSTSGLPVHHQLPEFTQTSSSQWCHPAISSSVIPSSVIPFYPALNLSQHQGLFQESVLHIRWPKYWTFSFSISPSNKYSGLISFRMDWLDLLVVQRTLRSLLQHHSSKVSILQCSAFFIVQFSHLHMTTGKIIALTIRTFVGKVMSLLFKALSRFDIAILPRSELKWSESLLVMSDSLWPHGLYCPWNSLGQNTGVGNLSLLQGILPTQGLNPGLPHCRGILYHLSHQGSPLLTLLDLFSYLGFFFLVDIQALA